MFDKMESYIFEMSIGRIPTVVTTEHHEVLSFWKKSGIQNADLIHVDGHSDMYDKLPEDLKGLQIANFICPAFHSGIVSSIYWFNPHSPWNKCKLMDFGSREGENGRKRLSTQLTDRVIKWVGEDSEYVYVPKMGKAILPLKMKLERSFILDIDLDAFSCVQARRVQNSLPNYDCENGWRERLLETERFLRRFKKPDLITLTRSQGEDSTARTPYRVFNSEHVNLAHKGYNTYVPPEKVDEVQGAVITALEDLYF